VRLSGLLNLKVNLKGDLFATGLTFALINVVRLGSSLVLTRILAPEAYGIITILLSASYIIEMLSDIGLSMPVVRHPNGDDPRFLNTAWTLKLIRATMNTLILLIGAPLIASLYGSASLIAPLRVFSVWILIGGLESMSFVLAVRRRNSRIIMYSELFATCLSTLFAITYTIFSRNYWGMLFAILLNRAVMSTLSYFFYRQARPRLVLDRAAARDILAFSRYSMPSSMITLAINQFDRVIFLRLFDLKLLGIYGLAANLAGSIEGLIGRISQMVLYPRCAHNYLTDRSTFSIKYYTENARVFLVILAVPAAVGGAAQFIIKTLYDPRYALAGAILQAFMVRAGLLALASPAEDMLIASGESHIILVANVFRVVWMVVVTLLGYWLFGLMGFVYGIALGGLPPLIYYLWLQRRKGLLVVKYEFYRLGFLCGLAVSAYAASSVLMSLLPTLRIRS
jgi:O-antigen/teichoic acid export membrane protein